MPTGRRAGDVRDALIQLQAEGMQDVDRVIETIEEIGGRVLLSYPPHAIVASLPDEKINELRGKPGIRAVDTEEISGDRVNAAPQTMRVAMAAWNEHLAGQRAPREQPSLGLSWDAPGRLPPDPPPDIREMLRRRERDMETDTADQDSS
jgi:hypothetical protein